MTTLEQELRAEARARHAELNFDGDLPIGDMLAMRAADEINRLSSKLDKIRELIGSPESEQDAFGRGGPEAAVCASVAHEILAIIGPEPPK